MFRSVFLRRVTFEKLLCGSMSQLQSQCSPPSTESLSGQKDESQSACAKGQFTKQSYHGLPKSHALTLENERKTLLAMCAQMKELDPHVALPIALASKMIALHIAEGNYVEVLHILTTHPHLEELTRQTILELQSSCTNVLTPTVIQQLLEMLACAEVHYIEQWLILFAECVAEQKFCLRQQQQANDDNNNNNNILLNESVNSTKTNEEMESDEDQKHMTSVAPEQEVNVHTTASASSKENDTLHAEQEADTKALEQCRRTLHDSIMRLVKVQPISHYPAVFLRAICEVSDGAQRADREDVLYVLQMALNASNHHTTNNNNNNGGNNKKSYKNETQSISPSVHASVFIDPDYFRDVLKVIVDDGKDYRRGAILWKWMRHSSACWDAEAASYAVMAHVHLRELSEAIQCLQTLAEVNINPTVKAQVALLNFLAERTPALPHYADKLVEHWYGVNQRLSCTDSTVERENGSKNTNVSNSNSNSSHDDINVKLKSVFVGANSQSTTLQINSKVWFGVAQQVGQGLIYLHFRLRNHENVLRLLRDAAYALMTQWHKTKNITSISVGNEELERLLCLEQQQQRREALYNVINFVQDIGMAFVFRHFAKDIAFNPLLKECFHDMPVEYAVLDNKPFVIGSLIVIEREISAIEERHTKEATSKINTSTSATVNESAVKEGESKNLEMEKDLNQQQQEQQTLQSALPSNHSIYKRLASVVIDDVGFAELARFLADEQNSSSSPVERLHLIRNVAMHLRCNVPREVRGWLELLESDEANNNNSKVDISNDHDVNDNVNNKV